MKVFSLKELCHEATLPKKNIIFEHLKEDITLICRQKPNYDNLVPKAFPLKVGGPPSREKPWERSCNYGYKYRFFLKTHGNSLKSLAKLFKL